jgi:hypothetical protein
MVIFFWAAPVFQLTDSETFGIVIHPDRGINIDGCNSNEVSNEEEEISVDKCISLTEELIHRLGQNSFITKQHIMWVYKVQDILQEKKRAKI